MKKLTKSKSRSKSKTSVKRKITKRKTVRKRKNPDKFEAISSGIRIPENKEDAFKLGFLNGLRDGFEHFSGGKLYQMSAIYGPSFDQPSAELFFKVIQNRFDLLDVFEAGRYFGIKKGIEQSRLIKIPFERKTKIISISQVIMNYIENRILPNFRVLENL